MSRPLMAFGCCGRIDILYAGVVTRVLTGFKDSFGEPRPPPGALALLSSMYAPVHEHGDGMC